MDYITEMKKSLTDIGHGIKCGIVKITPELAQQLINTSTYTEHNRKLKMPVVNQLMRDMQGGNWTVTHQGIALDEFGFLYDGYTRLNACVMSGIPFWTMVTFGIPQENVHATDSGQTRSILQQLHMMGLKEATKSWILLAKPMMDGYNQAKIPRSSSEIAKFIYDHKGTVEFMLNADGIGIKNLHGMSWAGRAAIARATYSCLDPVSEHMFRKFALLFAFKENAVTQQEQLPKLLANAFINDKNSYGKGPKELIRHRQEDYRKSELAIFNFLNQVPVKQIRAAEKELFPLNYESGKVSLK